MKGERAAIDVVRNYLAALQAGAVGEDLARFFTPDAVQTEFPNRLNPAGQTSDLATLLARTIQGRKVLSSQHFEIVSEVVQGNTVAIEARWTGVLAIALATLPAGSEMRAHFAMFFECRDGCIHRQRNYDCFESW